MLNIIKNISIIADFIVSFIAFAIQKSNPSLSGGLYMLSAIILLLAFICVIMEIFGKKKKKEKSAN